MNVRLALQVVAVIALALLGQFALRKRKRHIEEKRQVRLWNTVMPILEIDNPLPQPLAVGRIVNLRTLVTHIGIDIAVDDHEFTRFEPTADHRGGFGTVARINQRHKVRVDLIERPQFAAQETCDQFAVNRCVETREMKVFICEPLGGKPLLQHSDLGGFAGPVEAFENNKGHNIITGLCSSWNG